MVRFAFPTVFAVALAAALAVPCHGAGYCADPERVARWEQLSRRHPEDVDVQILDALRLGLCQKVASGVISERRMLEIFWSTRAALVADEASDALTKFLDREADRRRGEKARDARLRRLEEEYIQRAEEVAELGVDIRALQRELERGRERYQRRCVGEEREERSCQRAREELEELRRELRSLRDDEDRARRRSLAALQRLEEAQL
jgi:predicted RNase H-like nuclease (RuvC/YqgF family)